MHGQLYGMIADVTPHVRMSMFATSVCVCVCVCVCVSQVYTIERWSNALRVVGYAAVPCFLDVRTREQPLSKNVQDYVLNAVSEIMYTRIHIDAQTHTHTQDLPDPYSASEHAPCQWPTGTGTERC